MKPELGIVASLNAHTPLAQALQACKRHFVSAAVFSALLNLLFIAPMLYMLQVYDRVVPTRSTTTLVLLTVVLLLALGTLSLLDFVRSRLLVRASARLDKELAGVIIDTTVAQSNGGPATIARQSMREFDTLRQVLTGAGILALFDAPWTPIYILICFVIHPLIGLLAIAGGAVLLTIAWRNEKATAKPLQLANEAAAVAYAAQDQTTASADVVRALGMRGAMVERHLRDRELMMRLQTKASFDASGYVAVSKFARLLLQSLALGLGALLAINNLVTPGAIFAASFMVGRALAPIDQLLGAWKSIIQARGAYHSIEKLLAGAAANVGQTLLPTPEGRLDVEQLTVVGSQPDSPILKAVSFDVDPGESVAVVGPSGAGKSTLVRLLAGAAQPDSGAIRFDGAEQRDWDSERLARHVGYMPQEPSLFAGSIKENIARFRTSLCGDSESIDAAAVEAARRAGAHEMILRLPGGYDYRLGLGGRGLSLGQAQRIAFARALFGDPQYLILDEPNAHLDADGDLQLITSLAEAKEAGVTIIVVAHKLSILPIIDKLLVIKEGKLELFGPKHQVMDRIGHGRTPRPLNQTVAGAAK